MISSAMPTPFSSSFQCVPYQFAGELLQVFISFSSCGLASLLGAVLSMPVAWAPCLRVPATAEGAIKFAALPGVAAYRSFALPCAVLSMPVAWAPCLRVPATTEGAIKFAALPGVAAYRSFALPCGVVGLQHGCFLNWDQCHLWWR
jgi:hypothetical protein